MTNKQQTTDIEEVWGNIELPGFGDDKLLAPNLNHILAAMDRAKDPVWQAKNKLGNQKRAQDPEWRAKNKLVGEGNAQNPEWQANIEKRTQDPIWQANQKIGAQKRVQNPEWQANNKLGAEKRTQDPIWQANQKIGAQKRVQNPEWQANNKLGAEKRMKTVIGIHRETGEIIMLRGTAEMKAAGFDRAYVSSCAKGKLKHYKNYIWSFDEE